MSSFPIVEYESDPDCYCRDWLGRTTLDLRWVVAARPYSNIPDREGTTVVLVGGGQNVVKCPYGDFVRDWLKAKGLEL